MESLRIRTGLLFSVILELLNYFRIFKFSLFRKSLRCSLLDMFFFFAVAWDVKSMVSLA